MTTICIPGHHSVRNAAIKIEWLPPTVEFIHITSIDISKKSPFIYLPRALKYLYLRECNDKTVIIDCAHLPRKMEELILMNSITAKEIRLHSFPETMRYVHIHQMINFTDSIFVDYSSIPDSLQEIRAPIWLEDYEIKKRVKVVGEPGAVELQTKYDRRYPKMGSTYLKMFEKRKS